VVLSYPSTARDRFQVAPSSSSWAGEDYLAPPVSNHALWIYECISNFPYFAPGTMAQYRPLLQVEDLPPCGLQVHLPKSYVYTARGLCGPRPCKAKKQGLPLIPNAL